MGVHTGNIPKRHSAGPDTESDAIPATLEDTMRSLNEMVAVNYRRPDGSVDWEQYHKDMERKQRAFDRKGHTNETETNKLEGPENGR